MLAYLESCQVRQCCLSALPPCPLSDISATSMTRERNRRMLTQDSHAKMLPEMIVQILSYIDESKNKI